MTHPPGIFDYAQDVSFYDSETATVIIEGQAGMHLLMLPEIGDTIELTDFGQRQSNRQTEEDEIDGEYPPLPRLPFVGIVTDLTKNYHLHETEREKDTSEWVLSVSVYVKRIPSVYDYLSKSQ